MNRTQRNWTVPVSGVLLLATAVSADQDLQTYLNSTNRISVSLRYGLNVSGRFKGPASINFPTSFPVAGGRRTPNGDPYNYDDGYVLTDISGNAGNQTWYWGYDKSSQVNMANDTISFDRTTVPGRMPGGNDDATDNSSHLGAEIAYSYELGVKQNWHGFRYGIEAAVNWMPISFSGNMANAVALMHQTDTYSFTPGTTPPGFDESSELPYQGTFQGPNFVINVPAVSSVSSLVPGATFLIQQKFDANLWGFRLGPYAEMPVTKHRACTSPAAWPWACSMVTPPGAKPWTCPPTARPLPAAGAATIPSFCGATIWVCRPPTNSTSGGGWRRASNSRTSAYDHNFGGRTAEVDLSNSIFIHAGLSYSF